MTVVDDLERIEGLIGIAVYRLQAAGGDVDRIRCLKRLAADVNACRHGRGFCVLVALTDETVAGAVGFRGEP